MKKIILLCSCLLATVLLFAQPAKGRFLLGGSVGYSLTSNSSSNATPTERHSTTNTGLTAGFFPADNLLVALTGRFSNAYSAYSIDSLNYYLRDQYAIGVLLRRYYPLGKQFYLTFEGSATYEHGSGYQALQTIDLPLRHNGFTVAIGPGISYSFGKRLLFDINLGQLLAITSSSQVVKNEDGKERSRSTRFDAGIGPGGSVPFNIGFNILLGK